MIAHAKNSSEELILESGGLRKSDPLITKQLPTSQQRQRGEIETKLFRHAWATPFRVHCLRPTSFIAAS